MKMTDNEKLHFMKNMHPLKQITVLMKLSDEEKQLLFNQYMNDHLIHQLLGPEKTTLLTNILVRCLKQSPDERIDLEGYLVELESVIEGLGGEQQTCLKSLQEVSPEQQVFSGAGGTA